MQEAYIKDRNKVPPEFKFKCDDYVEYIGDIVLIENEIAIVKTVDDGETKLKYFIEFLYVTTDAYKQIWAKRRIKKTYRSKNISN